MFFIVFSLCSKAQETFYHISHKTYYLNKVNLHQTIKLYLNPVTNKVVFTVSIRDNKLQQIMIKNGKIRFDITNIMFIFNQNKIIIITPFNFCKAEAFYDGKKQSMNGFKYDNSKNDINSYFYFLDSPSNYSSNLTKNDKILIYVPIEDNSDEFLGPSYFFSSPITLLLSNTKLKFYIYNQILKEIKGKKLQSKIMNGCN